MTSKTEASVIRSQLRLRKIPINPGALISQGCRYEVYTTLHGSGIFKWYGITKERYDWYVQTFPGITIEIG